MFKVICTILFLLAISSTVRAQSALQTSHIEANVPEARQFNAFLRRDLLAYFKANGKESATKVELKLLRDAPTQSGVAYPKYYAWVEVFSDDCSLQKGAVRTAAINKVRFEVADFVTIEQLRADDGTVEQVFPAALVPGIKQLAKR